MLRGADIEIAAAARKKERYRVVLEKMKRIAGREGLNVGAIGACPGDITPAVGIRGDADWGP
jgi:hypothetical protein